MTRALFKAGLPRGAGAKAVGAAAQAAKKRPIRQGVGTRAVKLGSHIAAVPASIGPGKAGAAFAPCKIRRHA